MPLLETTWPSAEAALLDSRASFIDWYTGESESLVRMYSTIRPSGPASRNGTRHPQPTIALEFMLAVISVASVEPASRPMAVDAGISEQ